jgi:nucleotide-binding universal stress UspA family protein
MSGVIVVGFDGSESSRAALRCATRRRGDARVVIAHAPAISAAVLGHPYYYERDLERSEEHARQVVDEAKSLVPADVPTETRTPTGSPARALADLARELDADEIAVGSRGFGRFRGAALGSVSHALLHESDRPVLVVPRRAVERELSLAAAGDTGEAPILVVGYDGSDHAAAAVDYATRRAAAVGGQVVAVCAFTAPSDWLGAPYYQSSLDDQRELAREVVGRLADRSDVETDVVLGPPAEALARTAQARDAAEIVVGARGLGVFRAALGSVSHDLLHEADRPVLIVPSSTAAPGNP